MAWIGLENMGHLDHTAIKTNTNSLFFQENEGVNRIPSATHTNFLEFVRDAGENLIAESFDHWSPDREPTIEPVTKRLRLLPLARNNIVHS